MSATDESTKKVFAESQERLQSLSRQLLHCKSEVTMREKNIRLSTLTAQELDAMKPSEGQDDIVLYKAVGKCFLNVQKDTLFEEMKAKREKDQREANVLAKTREYLEKNITDIESQLKEMLAGRI